MLASKDNLNEPSALTKNEIAIFTEWTITKLEFSTRDLKFGFVSTVHTRQG